MRRSALAFSALLTLSLSGCLGGCGEGSGSEDPVSLSVPSARVTLPAPAGPSAVYRSQSPSGKPSQDAPADAHGYEPFAYRSGPRFEDSRRADGGPAGAAAPTVDRIAGRSFGLIINGDDEGSTCRVHHENAGLGAAFLRRHYGVAADDLIVLTPGAGPATRAGIRDAARAIASRAGPQDRIVVYTTGHGTVAAGRIALVLARGEMIAAAELAGLFADARAGRLVYIGDQCHGGGIAAAFAALGGEGREVVALSATDAGHSTVCRTFIRPFFQAFDDPRADRDADGLVSEDEAFLVARSAHRSSLANNPEMSNALFYRNGAAPPRPRGG